MSELNLIEIRTVHREIVWQWRNDIETRRLSFNNKIITWQEHIHWFDKLLKNKSSKFFIGEINNIPVGLIGFKNFRENNICYEVNINISPKYRGKGIGKKMLKFGIKNLKEFDRNLDYVVANIKTENFQSIALFESFGFVLVNFESNKYTYKFFVD